MYEADINGILKTVSRQWNEPFALEKLFLLKRIELLLNFQKWNFIILKTVKITIKILVGKLTIYYIWNMICINGLRWF